MANSHLAFSLSIKGLVQGVGFRPLCLRLACKYGLFGEVCNDGNGVLLKLQFTNHTICLDDFIKKLKSSLPPLVRIDSIQITPIKANYKDFSISKSISFSKSTPILSDFAFCKDCKEEFFDKSNRRYLYPFITCTNCGPRFSIIKALPYDRINTSMDEFTLCNDCLNEYNNPSNRRFHAQPISCPNCAINIHAKSPLGSILAFNNAALKQGVLALKQGKIIAFKGTGGFHLLACIKASDKLRLIKHRPKKAFILLCKDIKMAKKLCAISRFEEENLTSIKRAIILLDSLGWALPKTCKEKNLEKKAHKKTSFEDKNYPAWVQKQIAPHSKSLGIMLPPSPMHLALFEFINEPLIATSANLKGESIITSSKDLAKKLGGFVDLIIDNERKIINSSDDSLLACVEANNKSQISLLRASRGFAPFFIDVSRLFAPGGCVLAMGAMLKNTFAIYHKGQIILSPFMGDLSSLDVQDRFIKALDFMSKTYKLDFTQILADMHPGFTYPLQDKITLRIPHHFAHFCAVYFEYLLKANNKTFIKTSLDESLILPNTIFYPNKSFQALPCFICFAFDGMGYGLDGLLWGGEVLYGNLAGFRRIMHIENYTLINKDTKNIANIALSMIIHYNLEAIASKYLQSFANLSDLLKVRKISKLKSSSLGRIFDAAIAIIFGIKKIEYEGQAGLLCEKYYDENLNFSYKFEINKGKIIFKDIIIGALKDTKIKACTGLINAVANLIAFLCAKLSPNQVVFLAGGVFLNTTLLRALMRKNINFFSPQMFPSNDGAIALGQLAYFLHQRS